MQKSRRVPRRAHILDVAAEVLDEKGYRDTTMLEVARRSNASKETLYAWFGDKLGLFEAVIRRNAGRIRLALNGHLDSDTSVESALADFGRELAAHLLCDNAVSINRAAISEARAGPSLAGSLSKSGREPIRRTSSGISSNATRADCSMLKTRTRPSILSLDFSWEMHRLNDCSGSWRPPPKPTSKRGLGGWRRSSFGSMGHKFSVHGRDRPRGFD